MDESKVLQFYQQDNIKFPELTHPAIAHRETHPDKTTTYTYNFGAFKVDLAANKDNYLSAYTFTNNQTGDSFDLHSLLPSNLKIGLIEEPSGGFFAGIDLIGMPLPSTLARLYTGIHEIEHYFEYHSYDQDRLQKHDDATRAISYDQGTPEQNFEIYQNESATWNRAYQLLSEIENNIKTAIIPDRRQFLKLVDSRLATYG